MPQLGPNDTSAMVLHWAKKDGETVRSGEVVCVAETTKSAFDIECEQDGYVTILKEAGETVDIGDVLAVICTKAVNLEDAGKWATSFSANKHPQAIAEAKRFTEKARLLATKHGIDIETVKSESERITEADVLQYVESGEARQSHAMVRDTVEDLFSDGRTQRLLVIGAGGGAVQIMDTVSVVPNQKVVMLVDDTDSLQGKMVAGVPIAGKISYDLVESMFEKGRFDAAIISVSTSIPFRVRVFGDLRARGIPFANVIHPTVYAGSDGSIGSGNVILPFCHIGPCTRVGDNNFISAYCSIEHHNVLGSHCSFGPAVITSADVRIRDKVRFGMGVFVEPHLTIGSEALIASGCVIVSDIGANMVAKSKLNYSVKSRTKRE